MMLVRLMFTVYLLLPKSAALLTFSVEGITNALGLHALEAAMSTPRLRPCVLVARMVWEQFLQVYSQVPSLLRAFDQSEQNNLAQHPGSAIDNQMVTTLSPLPLEERLVKLSELILDCMISIGQQRVGVDEPLLEAGLDSLAAIELRNLLSQSLGNTPLTAGLLFDYPTVSKLARYLHSLMFGVEVLPSIMPRCLPQISKQSHHNVLLGPSCLLPCSDNFRNYWCTLSKSTDAIRQVPRARWEEARFAECAEPAIQSGNTCYTQAGGFVTQMEEFDTDFFRISVSEVSQMDPQQCALLEVSHPLIFSGLHICMVLALAFMLVSVAFLNVCSMSFHTEDLSNAAPMSISIATAL